MSSLIIPLALGFLGSFHCIGMCGPIALALPLGRRGPAGKVAGVLLYNAGRIMTYSILGLISGLIGKGFSLMGLQQVLSVLIGIVIIATVVLSKTWTSSIEQKMSALPVLKEIKTAIQQLFRRASLPSFFLIGGLNGLLPCGFVYIALPMAMATGTSWQGALFMALFGLSTVPAMMIVSFSHRLFSLSFRNNVKRALPVFMFLLGVLLVVRGLNLGLPYISPQCDANGHVLHSCCQKK